MTTSPLRHYLNVLRRHLLLIVGLPLIAIFAAVLITSRQESTYRAHTKLFVGQVGGAGGPEIGTRAITQTMTRLLRSEVVTRSAIARSGVEATPKQVLKKLKVKVAPDSAVLDVSLDWSSRRDAEVLLGEIADVFTGEVGQKLRFDVPSAGSTPGSSKIVLVTRVFDPPYADPERVAPKPAQTVVFAGALGLLLGIVFAFLRESTDDRIRGRRDAEMAFDAPLIGVLPPGASRQPLARLSAAGADGRSIREAIRLLRASLRFSRPGLAGPTVLVTSARAGEGTTTVTACVGLALALAGKRVICVDADVRNPSLHRLLGIAGDGPGLVDVVWNGADPQALLHDIDLSPFSRSGMEPAAGGGSIGNGGGHPLDIGDGSGLVGSLKLLEAGGPTRADVMVEAATFKQLLLLLGEDADYVVVDAPPLLTSGDSFPLVLQSDDVVLAARAGRTTRTHAEAARDTLKALSAKRVAVVLTHAEWLGTVRRRGSKDLSGPTSAGSTAVPYQTYADV